MLNRILAAMAAVFLIAWPTTSLAQNATVTFNGAFDAPATGTYSGSYLINTGTNTVISGSVTTTPGLAEDGVTNLPGATHNFLSQLASPNIATFSSAAPVVGNRGAYLVVTGTLSGPTGTVQFGESVCGDALCNATSAAAADRRLSSASTFAVVPVPPPATIPTMGEWAMILFGGLLAGGAAHYVQRRRFV